jgi:ribonuclease T1
MITTINRFFKFFTVFFAFFTLMSCNNVAQNPFNKQQHHHQSNNGAASDTNFGQQSSNDAVPTKAYDLLKYIKANGSAPNGYVGGRTFMNREKRLVVTDASGSKIKYQEWDVNPKQRGRNRGTERIITGSDNTAYYTGDHYKTFTKFSN